MSVSHGFSLPNFLLLVYIFPQQPFYKCESCLFFCFCLFEAMKAMLIRFFFFQIHYWLYFGHVHCWGVFCCRDGSSFKNIVDRITSSLVITLKLTIFIGMDLHIFISFRVAEFKIFSILVPSFYQITFSSTFASFCVEEVTTVQGELARKSVKIES